MGKPNALSRVPKEFKYKKLFLIVTEGAVTEKDYFCLVRDENPSAKVETLQGTKSNVKYLLKTMQSRLEDSPLLKNDEAWIVFDRDNLSEAQIQEVRNWASGSAQYNAALTNPKFEFWLLLHYEAAKGVGTATEVDRRLKRYVPGYDKKVKHLALRPYMRDAVKRAKQIMQGQQASSNIFGSDVYLLVERILNHK